MTTLHFDQTRRRAVEATVDFGHSVAAGAAQQSRIDEDPLVAGQFVDENVAGQLERRAGAIVDHAG